MTSYWDIVPLGHWVITDITDAEMCLLDPESRFIGVDITTERIHVFGPAKKAVIIDLHALTEAVGGAVVSDLMQYCGVKPLPQHNAGFSDVV